MRILDVGRVSGIHPGSNAAIDLDTDRLKTQLQVTASIQEAMTLARRLVMTHPDYDAQQPKWRKYLDLYMSNDVYRFIARHFRENKTTWLKRVERGYYINYVASVVDLFTSYIYSAPIDRKILPAALTDFFNEFYADATLGGDDYMTFLSWICTFTMVEGHVGVLVDMPGPQEEPPATEAERRERKIRPFLRLIHATQIKDWELDDHGNFNWVKLEIRKPQKRDWTEPVDPTLRHFVVWTKDSWTEYELKQEEVLLSEDFAIKVEVATLTGSGEHDLGEVPLVISKMQKDPVHPWFGVSFVRDIADINVGILNMTSLGDEEVFERCLNVLTMQQGPQGDAAIELSHGNVLWYPPDGDRPAYLTPGPTPLQLIGKWIEMLISEIQRLAKLKGPTGMDDVRKATSGIAYAFEFNETNQTLTKKSHSLQHVEMEIHRLAVKWMDKLPNFKGSVEYPTEFGVGDVLTEFQAMSLARSNFTSETAIKEFETKLVRKIFATASTQLRQEMIEEIQKGSPQAGLEDMFGMRPPAGIGGSAGRTGQEPEQPDKPAPPAPDEDSGT